MSFIELENVSGNIVIDFNQSWIDTLTSSTNVTIEYKAIVVSYNEEKDYLMFYWMKSDYARAHKFKLDVNRIARKKGYEV